MGNPLEPEREEVGRWGFVSPFEEGVQVGAYWLAALPSFQASSFRDAPKGAGPESITTGRAWPLGHSRKIQKQRAFLYLPRMRQAASAVDMDSGLAASPYA